MQFFYSKLIFLSFLVLPLSNIYAVSSNWYHNSNGVFLNYGSSGYVFDGFIELHTPRGLFFESVAIYETADNLDFNFEGDDEININLSLGLIRAISNNLSLAAGLSNYARHTPLDYEILNELFFGVISEKITGLIYFGFLDDLSPNFLSLLNLNPFFEKPFPVDFSIMSTYSFTSESNYLRKEDTNEGGLDILFRISKDYKSGISIGYNLSREKYESNQRKTYFKQGQNYQIDELVVKNGFFHSFHIGYLF